MTWSRMRSSRPCVAAAGAAVATAVVAVMAGARAFAAPAAAPAPAPDSTVAAAVATTEAPALRIRILATVVGSADERVRLADPSGLAVDAFGTIYVTDAALHRMHRFDARGAWLGESGSLGSDPGLLRRPGGVALLGTLAVAVLDLENRRVESYDLTGRRAGTLIDLSIEALPPEVGRVDAVAMASDKGGALYIADADGERVLAFEFSGRFVRALGGIGAKAGSFRGLRGLATAPRGEIVTAERLNARVQRLDPGGRVLASWPLDVRPGRRALPAAVDDSARVAVADESTGRLWIFDPSGRVLGTLEGLERPRSLAFAGGGTLLVGEAGSGRVIRLALERAPSTARVPE